MPTYNASRACRSILPDLVRVSLVLSISIGARVRTYPVVTSFVTVNATKLAEWLTHFEHDSLYMMCLRKLEKMQQRSDLVRRSGALMLRKRPPYSTSCIRALWSRGTEGGYKSWRRLQASDYAIEAIRPPEPFDHRSHSTTGAIGALKPLDHSSHSTTEAIGTLELTQEV